MSQERYYIGPGLKDKLRDVIFRVDGMPNVTSGPRVPNVYSGIDQPITKIKNVNPIRLAAYPKTVTWSVGQTQGVTIYDSGTLRPAGGGTVAARNVCNTFDAGADGGPNSTMSWCIVSEAVGGGTLAVEGPQMPVRLAAYPKTVTWSAGQTQAVTVYNSGTLLPSGEGTIVARNVCNTFDEGAGGGPDSTMSWCIVSRSAGGATLAVEGPQKSFRICTFTGSWSIGQQRTVAFKYQASTPNTVYATNLTMHLPSIGLTTPTDCAIAKEGGTWYLVSAIEHNVKKGTFSAPWNKGETKTVTLVNGGSVTATNRHASVAGTGTKNCTVGRDQMEWELIAAEC